MNEEIIIRQDRKYLIKFKLYTTPEEKIYDITPLIEFVQFNGVELIAKIFRQVHHNYAVLNLEEQIQALNSKKLTLGTYSESIPAELYFIKEFADIVEAIKEV
jgi:hypothetical protein